MPPTDNSYGTIGDLWNNYIEKYLPDKKIAIAWHKILIDYVQNCPDAIFPIRRSYPSKNKKEIQKYRGLFTKTDQDFSYFLTDNEHAKYYLKLCLEKFIPSSANDLHYVYKTRKFPLTCFNPIKATRHLVDFPAQVKHGFNKRGLYLAHIFAVNQLPYVVKQNDDTFIEKSAKKLFEGYFDYGDTDTDWIQNANKHHIRTLQGVSSAAKSFVIAAFMRYVHPFNYFFTPKKARWRNEKGDYTTNQIGEYKPLITFAQTRLANRYGEAYREFRELALVPTPPPVNNYEKTKINLTLQ